MYGVALEGGGMKGAYHLGAMKAIFECGYEIGGYVGTSIGAFNAAVLAQGDFEKLYDLWYNASTLMGIDIKEKELSKMVNKKLDFNSLKYWAGFLKSSISNKGIDTSKIKEVYSQNIDEKKLRESSLDYGMVTVSLTDRKPIYVYKEDIPEGMVATYAMASSNLPVFKQDKMLNDDKTYIDGGFYDNCPVVLLKKKGYKDIIEIRTKAIGVSRKIDRKKLNIITIQASKDLGNILFSDNTQVRKAMLMGYYDAIRVLKDYIGNRFYVIPTDNDKVFNMLLNLTDEKIVQIASKVKLNGISNMEPKKILFEKLMPMITNKLKNTDTSTYQKTFVSMMEYMSDDTIEEYKLYTFEDLIKTFKKKIKKYEQEENKSLIKNSLNIAILELIKNIEIE